MNAEFYAALELLQKEKGIPKSYMYDKIKSAIASAIKRDKGVPAENVDVYFDEEKKTVRVVAKKLVVEEVTNEAAEISLEEARQISARYDIDDMVEFECDTSTVGRIAAKVGKNVIIQAINEAVNGTLIQEFEARKDSIVTGKVSRVDEYSRVVYLEINGYDLPLGEKDQIPGDSFKVGDYVKVCVSDVRKKSKSQEILLSRTNNEFLARLFELEVPEIADGTVSIKAVSREAGSRAKVAVCSSNPDVDAVGACIGPRRARISGILENLNNERVDLIKYSEEPEEFIPAALAPATVRLLEIDKEQKSCKVAVAPDQLSLAIGKTGQNVRLAVRLTGYRIDICAE